MRRLALMSAILAAAILLTAALLSSITRRCIHAPAGGNACPEPIHQ